MTQAQQGDAGTELTVLLVEDNRALRNYIATVLRQAGCASLPCASAAEANAAAESVNRVDLVITDLELVDGSGLQLVNGLRHARPLLPALVISGYEERITELSAANDRADTCYLAKPFPVDQFLATIAALTQTRADSA